MVAQIVDATIGTVLILVISVFLLRVAHCLAAFDAAGVAAVRSAAGSGAGSP